MSILFINACVRENSRTLVLARDILSKMSGEVTELDLNLENIVPLKCDLLEKREKLIRNGNREDPMFSYARQFAEADEIVIAAPFWDLSFPALLKTYFEQITVSGITFEYINGKPNGLCKAKKLTYVTTSGGPIFADFGYEYIKALAKNFYGITETKAYRAAPKAASSVWYGIFNGQPKIRLTVLARASFLRMPLPEPTMPVIVLPMTRYIS